MYPFVCITTVLKLTPLILLIVIGLFHISFKNLTVQSWPSAANIGETALVLFFAFMGIETALNVSGEIKNPQQNIPRGILMSVFGVLLIYLLIQLVAQGVLGDELSINKEAPLATLASRLIGPVGGTIILVTSVVSMFGMLSGDVLASPRVLFAASKDKLLPAFLSRIHPRFATPYWSIIVYSVVGVFLASSGGFKQLATLASSSVLIIYLLVVLAMIRLRYKKNDADKAGFKIPGGLLIPILAIAAICWFLYHITLAEIIALSLFFITLTIIYFINREMRKGSIKPPGE